MTEWTVPAPVCHGHPARDFRPVGRDRRARREPQRVVRAFARSPAFRRSSARSPRHRQRSEDGGRRKILWRRMRGKGLTRPEASRIHLRMTKILTLRLDPELLGKAEARAARLGLDRAKYVRLLIEEDLAAPPAAVRRRFVSEDLAGLYEGPGTAATNKRVRDQLRRSNTRPRA